MKEPYDHEKLMRQLSDNAAQTGHVQSINALAERLASDLLRGPLATSFVSRFSTGNYQDATTTSIDAKKLALWAFAVAEQIVSGQEQRIEAVMAKMRSESSPGGDK
jgi:hypothetical protein